MSDQKNASGSGSQDSIDSILTKHLQDIRAGHDSKLKAAILAWHNTQLKAMLQELSRKSERHESDGICNSEFYVSTDYIHDLLASLDKL